jgi:hypothetical protein
MTKSGQDGPNVYRVRTLREDRPVDGSDSCVADLPDGLYVRLPGQEPMLDLRILGRVLRQLSEQQAERLGTLLHHAEWVITSDPAVVEQRVLHDEACAQCRADADQALAHLAAVGGPLLVGTLYWAEQ